MKIKTLRRLTREIQLVAISTRPLPRMKKIRGSRRYWRQFDQITKWSL